MTTRDRGKNSFKLSIQTTMLGIKEMPQRRKSKRLKQPALEKQEIAPRWRSSKGIQHRNISLQCTFIMYQSATPKSWGLQGHNREKTNNNTTLNNWRWKEREESPILTTTIRGIRWWNSPNRNKGRRLCQAKESTSSCPSFCKTAWSYRLPFGCRLEGWEFHPSHTLR